MKNSENIKTRHYFLIMLLLITANFVQAQSKKIIFSNNNQQTEIEGNASINVADGNITVTTKTDKLIIDEQPAILGFYPDAYQLASFPDGITVNWTAAYAANCSASVPVGNASWSGTKGSNGSYEVPVTINTAGTTLRLTCTSLSGGSSVSKEFTIEQASTGTGGTTGDPVINKFVLSNYPGQTPTIPADGPYTVEWEVTNLGSGSCTAYSSSLSHGGWTGVLLSANSSKGITISGEPVLTISCSNGGNPVSKTITITNSSGGTTPVGCSNVSPPTGMTLAPVFDQIHPIRGGGLSNPIPGQNGYGDDFAELGGHGVLFTHITDSNYVSIGNIYIPNDHSNYFSKNNSRHLGASIFFGDPTTSYGPFNKAVYSMSTCPGDFDMNKTAICVGAVNKGDKFYVSTDPQNGWASNNGCIVEKGETYYLNFFSGSDVNAINNPNLRGCGIASKCGTIIQQGKASY